MTREDLQKLEAAAFAHLKRTEIAYDLAADAYTKRTTKSAPIGSTIDTMNMVAYERASRSYDLAYENLSRIESTEPDDEPFGYDGLRQDMADLAAYRART